MLPHMFYMVKLVSGRAQCAKIPRSPRNAAIDSVVLYSYENIKLDVVQEVTLSGWTNLHRAAIDNDVMLVHMLIRSGANVNTIDSMGRTPLHYAASDGNLEVMRALMRAGIDESIRGQAGRTARDRAKSVGKEAIYDAALYQAKKMQEGEGYFGWLAEQMPIDVITDGSHDTNNVAYNDSETTTKVEWKSREDEW